MVQLGSGGRGASGGLTSPPRFDTLAVARLSMEGPRGARRPIHRRRFRPVAHWCRNDPSAGSRADAQGQTTDLARVQHRRGRLGENNAVHAEKEGAAC